MTAPLADSPFQTQPQASRGAITLAIVVAYLALLTAVILFKLPFYSPHLQEGRTINLVPFPGLFSATNGLDRHEIIQNIALFIPLGIYVTMLSKWNLSRRILAIAALSLAYEALQFIFAIGVTDITDLINNTAGGIIGIGIYAALSKVFHAKTPQIVRAAATVLTIAAVADFTALYCLSHFSS